MADPHANDHGQLAGHDSDPKQRAAEPGKKQEQLEEAARPDVTGDEHRSADPHAPPHHGPRPAGTGAEPHDSAASHHDHGSASHAAHGEDHAAHGRGHDHGHDHHHHHAMMVEDFRRRFWISLIVTVPILLLSPMIQGWLGLEEALDFPGSVWVLTALSTFVYLYGGWPFLTGLVEELRDRSPGMMTLVALAITVAYGYSLAIVLGLAEGMLFFWETATLIDLMLVGHWIEMRSVMGASRALEELARLMPAEAHRLREDGSVENVPVASLRRGDQVRILSSEKIPADGTVVEGSSSVNESMLTGESEPVEKSEGSTVIAGAVNGMGTFVMTVSRTGEESYLNQVIGLVREAQQSKSRTQNLANRAAFYLTITAIVVGVATFIIWYGVAGSPLSFAIERTVTVMVITCPHALGLAIPLVVSVSTSISARQGLLIRNRTAFEQARNVDTIVFDKTGTLTEGRFGVTEIVPLSGTEEEEVLRLSAAAESGSEHPIAAGILRAAEERGVTVPSATQFDAVPGKGVRAVVEGRLIRMMSPGAVASEGIEVESREIETLLGQGKTVVFAVRDDAALGAIVLADVVRESSREAIRLLHEMGIDVMMLTGDRQEVADWVADELGLDRVLAEVLPDQKAEEIRRLQGEGRTVAMTGDGVNDAPALATADVGIAIGAGTDVALETADVVLVDSDPRDAVTVIRLARATYRKMVQNLWYAAGYNIVAIPLAAGALAWTGFILNPAAGAILMSLSTIVVAINARTLRV